MSHYVRVDGATAPPSLTPAERVANGLRRLDQADPDWADKIRYPLELDSACMCVLGQVFGEFDHDGEPYQPYGFWRGLDALHLTNGYSLDGDWAHGFSDPTGDLEEFTEITQLWYDAIAERTGRGAMVWTGNGWGNV